jgi:sporulation protein YlmC with PRC-barrel domain
MKRLLSLLSLVLILALGVAACAPAQEGTEGIATVEVTELPDVLGTPTVEVTVESGTAATPVDEATEPSALETPMIEATEPGAVSTPTGEASQTEGESDQVLPPTGLMDANRTSNLIGYPVYNMNNEQIGEVEGLLIDLDTSQVKYAIVGLGGFLDLGEKLIPVPGSRDRSGHDPGEQRSSRGQRFRKHG